MEDYRETISQKNKRHESYNHSIPNELMLTEIIPRVPTKSACRFKCVSRHWRDEISSPQFRKLHFSQQPHKHGVIVRSDSSLYTVLNYACYDGSANSIVKKNKLSCEQLRIRSDLGLPSKSCNGLVCSISTDNDKYEVCIWNLKVHPIRKVQHNVPRYHGGELERWEFGYVPSSQTYKILHVYDTNKASVYSFKTTEWRDIDTPSEIAGFRSDENAVGLANGKFHWMMKRYSDNRCTAALILAFDFAAETFNVIPLPECFNNGNGARTMRVNACVGSINDHCLCVATQGSDGLVQVWALQRYGDCRSWSRVMNKLGEKKSPAADGKVRSFVSYGVGKYNNVMMHLDGQLYLVYWDASEKIYKYVLIGYHTKYAKSYVETEASPSCGVRLGERGVSKPICS